MAMTAKWLRRWPWKVLALVVTAVGLSTATTWLGSCPDWRGLDGGVQVADCQISYYAGGPIGWVIIAVCAVVLFVSLKQAYGRPGDQFP